MKNFGDIGMVKTIQNKKNLISKIMTIIIFALFLTSTLFVIKAGTIDEQWSKSFGYVNSREIANDIAVDSGDNVIVTGCASADYYTIKYSPNGYVSGRFDYDSSGVDSANAVAVDSNDNIIVTGRCFGSGSNNYYTIKYDSSGNELWGVAYDNNVSDDTAYEVAVDSDDNIIVTGCSLQNYLTIKYDSSGNEILNISYDSGEDDIAYGITTDSDDNIIVTGISSNNFHTIKYNKNGIKSWDETYDSGGFDSACSVVTDSDDNIIVTGTSSDDFYVIKYDPSGNEICNTTYDSGGIDTATQATVDNNDNIIISGYSQNNILSQSNYTLIELDKFGRVIWTKTYDSGEDDIALSVVSDSYNNIIITGAHLKETRNFDYHTIKYKLSNLEPEADFIYMPHNPNIDEQITFIDLSNDPDGYIISCEWDFGDGEQEMGSYVTHSYFEEGIYEVTLTVEDNDGATETYAKVISVINGSDATSIVDNSPMQGYTGNSFTFSAEITDNIGVDTVWVNYWYNDGFHNNDSMSHIGQNVYERTITIPNNSLDSLHYIITANNTNNVWSNTGEKTVAILDDEDPEIIEINAHPMFQKQNGHVNVTCKVNDNIGLNSVKININDPTGTNSTNSTMKIKNNGDYYYNNTYNLIGEYSFIIWANDTSNNRKTSGINTFSIYVNNPPYTPSNPSPPNGSLNVGLNADLWWTGGDPDGDTVTYDVYLEENNPSPDDLVSDNQSDTHFDPGTLNNDTHYYWQIIAEDTDGAITVGPVWGFTTKESGVNHPPNAPENPSPADGATGVGLNPVLSVFVSDFDGDALTVEFYDAEDDSLIGSTIVPNASVASVTWSNLDYEIIYSWYSIVNDSIFDNTSEIWAFTTLEKTNHPPNEPKDPIPENNSVNVGLNADLWWTGGDPDGDTVTYDLYLEENNPSPDDLVSDNQSDTHFDPGTLNNDTHYYWQIIAEDTDGAITVGPVWGFTTKESGVNHPPNAPENPSPADGATGVGLNPVLSVFVSDFDGDALTVEFYDAEDDSLIGSTMMPNASVASIKWSGLDYDTTYTWNVSTTDGQFWNYSSYSFKTKTESSGGGGGGGTGETVTNTPPIAEADGPYSAFVNEIITFDGSKSTDDGSIEKYSWKFGDGENGNGVKPTHSYSKPGRYTLTLTVTDDEGATDSDTATVTITIPNRIPSKPEVDGPEEGTKNTEYAYTAFSTDADNDDIQYYFDWDDGTDDLTEFLPNATEAVMQHSWDAAGIYSISVQATDNQSPSDIAGLTVLIDAHIVDDIGYITDDDADGTYDTFHDTNVETELGMLDGKYLIDVDGDGDWDYIYDINSEELTDWKPAEEKKEGYDYTNIIILVVIILILLIIFSLLIGRGKKARPKKPEEPPQKTDEKEEKVEEKEPEKNTKKTVSNTKKPKKKK